MVNPVAEERSTSSDHVLAAAPASAEDAFAIPLQDLEATIPISAEHAEF
jgi:hypothetical protein